LILIDLVNMRLRITTQQVLKTLVTPTNAQFYNLCILSIT